MNSLNNQGETDMYNNFENKIEVLRKSPIYAMSLGSKELFHSNFWGWIMENDNYKNNFIKFLFPEIDIANIDAIEREQGNRDLTVWTNDSKAYVIENKFKSLARSEQLIQYQTALKEKFVCGVITGIEKPPFEVDGWRFVSYYDIANLLIEISGLDLQYNQIVREYSENLKHIYNIIGEFQKINDNRLPQWDGVIASQLASVNLWDICQKISASKFTDYILAKVNNIVVPQNFTLGFGQSYSHGTAIIDFFLRNDKTSIGVQIQGNQFKLFVAKSDGYICDKLFNEFLDYGWFDIKFSKDNKKVFGYDTKMSPRNKIGTNNMNYNKYETSASSFVYQYFDINDSNNSYDALSELIVEFLNKAVTTVNLLPTPQS